MLITELVSSSEAALQGPESDDGRKHTGNRTNSFADLVGMSKLLEDGPVILCDAFDLPALVAMTPSELGILSAWVEGPDDATLYFEDRHGNRRVQFAAPSLSLALVSLTPEGVARLAKVARKLAELGSFRSLTPILLPNDSDHLRTLLATDLLVLLRDQARYAARLARELASMRGLFERTQNAFSGLESYVASLGSQPARMIFENAPDGEHETGGANVEAIRQILPASSLGLCAFQLYVTNDDNALTSVSLGTLEDQVTHERWKPAPSQLEKGWLTFNLSRSISGEPRSLEIVITSTAGAKGTACFALGAPQPLPEYRANVSGGDTAPTRSLAMRLWTGLPGVRSPSLDAPALESAPPRILDIPLSKSIIGSLRRITCDWTPDFAAVEALDGEGGFQCHPPPDGDVTVATMDDFVAEEMSMFSAVGRVESSESAPVEFALAYSSLPEDEVVARIRRDMMGSEASDYVFSGWAAASMEQPVRLSLPLLQMNGRMYFATRMANQGRNWYSWSTFKDICVRSIAIAADE